MRPKQQHSDDHSEPGGHKHSGRSDIFRRFRQRMKLARH
jgi:hypothetical protein